MKKNIFFALILLLSGCHSESTENAKTATNQSESQPKSRTEPGPYVENAPVVESTLKSNMNSNTSDGSIVVKVTAGADDSTLAPRYSPPGKGLELKSVEIPESLGFHGLETEVGLGWPATKQLPIKMLVSRATVDSAYTRLYIDSDANGKFDEEPIVAKASESRGNIWSSFSANLKVRYQTENPVVEDYPVALWIAVASVTEQPKVLEFRHDVDTAILEAINNKQRCFIKFETTWCGPCKTMTQHVFTAKDVVDVSEGIVCIKVDGDERRDLVERYAVKGYPTGVLLAADGTEATRFLGYQTVVEMTKFFETK